MTEGEREKGAMRLGTDVGRILIGIQCRRIIIVLELEYLYAFRRVPPVAPPGFHLALDKKSATLAQGCRELCERMNRSLLLDQLAEPILDAMWSQFRDCFIPFLDGRASHVPD